MTRPQVGDFQVAIRALRAIWSEACDEHHWELPDPFRKVKKQIKKRTISKAIKPPPEVFRYEDWVKVIENIDPFYRDVAEVMIMTGMIGSEIAGLKKEHIYGGVIHVRDSIVRRVERVDELKTLYRFRDIPITKALKERLDRAVQNASGHHVFSMESGKPFNVNAFRKTPWTKALEKAGVKYRNTYIMRHSFAEWCLIGGMNPERLIDLMGHGTKTMVYEVYGKYVKGIEKDAGLIREYLGNDFFDL